MSVTPASWAWSDDAGPSRLRAELAARGWCVVAAPALVDMAPRAPWDVAAALLGEPPAMVERQPVRAVEGGRSFASSRGFTPLHTDSQRWGATAPALQVMACARASTEGGETTLLDSRALLDRVAATDPALHRALYETPRRMPFVFGDVYGPTVALRGGALVFTHTPVPLRDDPVAGALQRVIDAMAPEVVTVRAGEALLVDNHRMLHGRREFRDVARSFTRLLVWARPFGSDPAREALARAATVTTRAVTEGASPWVRARFGEATAVEPAAERRRSVVLAMLRGVPPGVLSTREGVAEPELYRWRERLLEAGVHALTDAALRDDEDARARALVRGRARG
ncbi:MAG: TauD/TfdA family dioxygenase [Polyangiales bacterium]